MNDKYEKEVSFWPFKLISCPTLNVGIWIMLMGVVVVIREGPLSPLLPHPSHSITANLSPSLWPSLPYLMLIFVCMACF